MKEQVVWITGASSGIGEELAQQYARRGKIVGIWVVKSEHIVSSVPEDEESFFDPSNEILAGLSIKISNSVSRKVH